MTNVAQIGFNYIEYSTLRYRKYLELIKIIL